MSPARAVGTPRGERLFRGRVGHRIGREGRVKLTCQSVAAAVICPECDVVAPTEYVAGRTPGLSEVDHAVRCRGYPACGRTLDIKRRWAEESNIATFAFERHVGHR